MPPTSLQKSTNIFLENSDPGQRGFRCAIATLFLDNGTALCASFKSVAGTFCYAHRSLRRFKQVFILDKHSSFDYFFFIYREKIAAVKKLHNASLS